MFLVFSHLDMRCWFTSGVRSSNTTTYSNCKNQSKRHVRVSQNGTEKTKEDCMCFRVSMFVSGVTVAETAVLMKSTTNQIYTWKPKLCVEFVSVVLLPH